jgi:predicted RNA-binding Zn-ribbon protein involved in translation (DUF1610 family)
MEIILGIIIAVVIIIGLVVLVAVLGSKYSSSTHGANLAKIRGQIGEEYVARVLGGDLPNEKYVINNLTIVTDGKSSQIDHIVITKAGIFVIETKNFSGRVYGRANQKEWKQVLAYGKSRHTFYNPVLQNNTHIYRLRQALGRLAKKDCFISVIVFPKAELFIEPIDNVGNINNLIRIYNAPRQEIYNEKEINQIYDKLIDIKNNPQATDCEHIQGIIKTKQDIASNICPRCGKALVQRQGRYGNFYGCSGYPNCKFIKKQ